MYHKTKEGKLIYIWDLTDSHLNNVINLYCKAEQTDNVVYSITMLSTEYTRRTFLYKGKLVQDLSDEELSSLRDEPSFKITPEGWDFKVVEDFLYKYLYKIEKARRESLKNI